MNVRNRFTSLDLREEMVKLRDLGVSGDEGVENCFSSELAKISEKFSSAIGQ